MWKSGALGFCRISKPGGKRGKLAWGFGVFLAFHGASFPPRFSSRCSRSAATPTFFLLGAPFFALGHNPRRPDKNLAPGWLRNDDLADPRPETPPFWLRPPYRRASCASIHRASRCDGRYAPAGRECCPPRSDPRSARATWPRAVG